MTASGSTYGWWIAYLMPDNSTIFYNSQVTDNADFSKDIYDYDIFLPEWIKLTLSKNGSVYIENKWWYQRSKPYSIKFYFMSIPLVMIFIILYKKCS